VYLSEGFSYISVVSVIFKLSLYCWRLLLGLSIKLFSDITFVCTYNAGRV